MRWLIARSMALIAEVGDVGAETLVLCAAAAFEVDAFDALAEFDDDAVSIRF